MSHATACHVQLVLGNCTNLQLHVSHATEIQLQTTVARPKISSNVFKVTGTRRKYATYVKRSGDAPPNFLKDPNVGPIMKQWKKN
jgi:hypothetical protein